MKPHAPRVAMDLRPDGGVVVGDDGSGNAEVAIRDVGRRKARRSGRPLLVVRAWTLPDGVWAADIPALTSHRSRRSIARDTDVVVPAHVVHGPAAKALVTLFRDGRRGRTRARRRPARNGHE